MLQNREEESSLWDRESRHHEPLRCTCCENISVQTVSEKVLPSNVLVIWPKILKLTASQALIQCRNRAEIQTLMFCPRREQISFLSKVYGFHPDGNHHSAAGCLAGPVVFIHFPLFTGCRMRPCCRGLFWLSQFQIGISDECCCVSLYTKLGEVTYTCFNIYAFNSWHIPWLIADICRKRQ